MLKEEAISSRAILFKDGSDKRALFIFPGAGGTTNGLKNLCESLSGPFKIYVFPIRGFDGSVQPDTRVETMAQNYILELKKLQPRGPYLLCGHSFGGLVVFEMAQQLIAAGEKIDILLLLDTQINPSFWPVSYFISILLTRLRHHVSVLFSLPPNQLSSYITRTIQMMVNWFLYFLRLKKPMPLPVSELTPEFATARNAQLVAMANYRPSFYPSKMIYFRATDPSSTDPNVLWRRRVSELEVHVVTGGHCSMLEYPYLDNLVSTMQKCLPQ